MIIVAISGWAKSGKDTAAKMLISEYGFQRVAFADPLKDAVAKDFDFVRSSLDSQEMKETPINHLPVYAKDDFTKNVISFMFKEFRMFNGEKPESIKINDNGEVLGMSSNSSNFSPLFWTRRALCILEGSTKRTANPDYWVDKALSTAKKEGKKFVVISDLRYKSEIYALKMAMSEEDILVTVRVMRFDKNSSSDPSECDLDDVKFDIAIENRGSLEDFEKSVHKLAKSIIAVEHGMYT